MSQLFDSLTALDRKLADRGNGVIGRITFKSPGTNISYAPFDYVAVGQLIVSREVKVLISLTGGPSTLSEEKAAYMSNLNWFVIYGMDPRKRRTTVVHEATHVIQDWEDVESLVHYNEADAFIAESVTDLVLFPDSRNPNDGDLENKALAAAKMVLDQTAIDSNKNWGKVYESVVTAVGQRYKKYRQRDIEVEKGEGTSERTRFSELLRQITMINQIGGIALSVSDFGSKLLSPVVGSR